MEKEKKTHIIRAAAKRFDRHGMNKTTLDEIARDLRIGKATIYHYFKSKDELYFQVLEWEGSLLLEEIRIILANQEITLEEKLDLYLLSKENLQAKYKLVFDVVISILNDKSFERENAFFSKLNAEEEKYLSDYLSAPGKIKAEGFKDLIKVLLYQSWNFMFMKRLNIFVNIEKPAGTLNLLINFFNREFLKDIPD